MQGAVMTKPEAAPRRSSSPALNSRSLFLYVKTGIVNRAKSWFGRLFRSGGDALRERSFGCLGRLFHHLQVA
jgi:hypothetical protein